MNMRTTVIMAATITIQAIGSMNMKDPFDRSEHPTLSSLIQTAQTPQDVCAAVQQNVAYKADPMDKWQTSEETLDLGTGDCEDFAICVQDMCRELGYAAEVKILVDQKNGRAHAITMGHWAGSTWISSNGSFEWVPSEKELQEKAARMLATSADSIQTLDMASAGPVPPRSEYSSGRITVSTPTMPARIVARALRTHDAYFKLPYSDVESLQ